MIRRALTELNEGSDGYLRGNLKLKLGARPTQLGNRPLTISGDDMAI